MSIQEPKVEKTTHPSGKTTDSMFLLAENAKVEVNVIQHKTELLCDNVYMNMSR